MVKHHNIAKSSDYLGPRGLKSIAELRWLIGQSKLRNKDAPNIALLVGAGVDISLKENRHSWPILLNKLAAHGGAFSREQLQTIETSAKLWPVETAEGLKGLIGSKTFWQALSSVLSAAGSEKQSAMRNGLIKLIYAGLQLIVTLNYTSDVLEILKGSKKVVKVIEPSSLAAWNLKELLSPGPNIVHLIHLHGRPSAVAGNTPLLDKRSFDEAIFGSPYYTALLQRLFEDTVVVTVGSSFSDAPIRSAAAQALYRFPIAARVHVSLQPEGDSRLESTLLERGLFGSFSVKTLFYPKSEHEEAGKILARIADPLPAPSTESNHLLKQIVEIADYLDQMGDFESSLQAHWMIEHWESIKAQVEALSVTQEVSFVSWYALARLERHLRHFIWFFEDPETRSQSRRTVWSKVAALSTRFHSNNQNWLYHLSKQVGSETGQQETDLDRGIFEFALGAHEIRGRSAEFSVWANALGFTCKQEGLTQHLSRIRLAKAIWGSKPATPSEYQKLRFQAASSNWESIQAKITLDQVEKYILNTSSLANSRPAVPRLLKETMREEIQSLYKDAASTARLAGNLRREVGSIVTGSFIETPSEAEANLLAINRRFSQEGWRKKETSTHWWIYIGLLAILHEQEIKVKNPTPEQARQALFWLETKCGELEIPTQTSLESLKRNQFAWWKKFHPHGVSLAEDVLSLLVNS